jgi:hypothetical protein
MVAEGIAQVQAFKAAQVAKKEAEQLAKHGNNHVNIDCPTCNPHLAVLAEKVPMSHHVNSTIVCRISGEVMDSSNEPLAFPNGYVYSYKVSLVGDVVVLVLRV